MKLSDLNSHLDELLTPHLFSDYGPNGLQIGDGSIEVQKVAVAVSADLKTIEQAIACQANVLIVHHGILWNASKVSPFTDSSFKRLQLLIKHDLHLLAYHLPLDAHPIIGNNWKVAHDLQWDQLQSFGSFQPQIGVQGRFAPIHIHDFIQILTSYYGCSVKAQALGGKEYISSAALTSGGAYKEISQAIKSNVDCFITGNFDEPAWSHAMENHIHFLAFGHTHTEKIGPKALSQYINEQLHIKSDFIDTENNF